MYIPGDIYYKQFVTNNISGVSANADALPRGVLSRNGLDDFSTAALVYISNIDIGRYNVSGVIPSTYRGGDSVNVTVSGTITNNLTKAVFDLGVLDRPVSVTGNVPSVTTVTSAITLPATAPNNFIAPASFQPGVTVSVTGNVPTVGSVTSAITLPSTAPNNFITTQTLVPGVTVSVTGVVSAIMTTPVSVSGGTVNHLIDAVSVLAPAPANFLGIGSIVPGVTVSVTGNVPSVTTVTNAITLPATAPNNFIAPGSVQPGVTVSVTGNIPTSISGPVSVSGGTINHVIDAVNVASPAPANFLGIGSIVPGVTISVTGNIPSVTTVTNSITLPATAPNNFIAPASVQPGVTVSVTGNIPTSISGPVSVSGGTINNIINPVSITGVNTWSATDISQIRYKIGIDGTATAPVGQFAGKLELSSSGVRNVVVENGVDMNQWMSLIGAVLAGSSTVSSNVINYYAVNNNGTLRLQSTAVSGARQAITIFLPND